MPPCTRTQGGSGHGEPGLSDPRGSAASGLQFPGGRECMCVVPPCGHPAYGLGPTLITDPPQPSPALLRKPRPTGDTLLVQTKQLLRRFTNRNKWRVTVPHGSISTNTETKNRVPESISEPNLGAGVQTTGAPESSGKEEHPTLSCLSQALRVSRF